MFRWSLCEGPRRRPGLRHTGLVRNLVLGILFSTACQDAPLIPPTSRPVPSGGPLFQRYASIGNSITAGFQSLGMNDSTQLEAYPVYLARQFGLAVGLDFNVPLLNAPGCPPPLVNVFTLTRVGGGGPTDCALRARPIPAIINNVAVPFVDVIDVLSNFDPASSPSALTTLLLGGRTQLEAVAEVRPTFVTVWIGNGALAAITISLVSPPDAGNPALVTDPQVFATRYAQMMAGLDAIGTIEGGVLIGAVQVVGAPFVSSGLAYFVAAQSIPTLTVLSNCLDTAPIPGGGPNDTAVVSVPFPFGAAKLDSAAAGVPVTLDCTVPEVVTVAEAINIILAVAQYNMVIAQAASSRGWGFIDPNSLLQQLRADSAAIRPFPAFPPDPAAETMPFGTALSRDGIHPSGSTHRLIANALIAAINAAYGTTVPTLP